MSQLVNSSVVNLLASFLMTVLSLQARVYDNNTIHSINITLVNVSRDDNNFLLTCTAANIVGMINASVHLIVHCKYIYTHSAPLLTGFYIFLLIVILRKCLLVFSKF